MGMKKEKSKLIIIDYDRSKVTDDYWGKGESKFHTYRVCIFIWPTGKIKKEEEHF